MNDLAQKKVLLVEDDIYLLGLYARKFSQAGFTVYSAKDGLEALRAQAKYQPDALVLDLNLPEMNGWEVLAAIAKQQPNNMPICLVLSNYDRQTAEEISPLPSTVNDYMVKIQTTPEEVVLRLQQILNQT